MNVELLKKRIKILESDNLKCTLDLLELRKEHLHLQAREKINVRSMFSDALARAQIRNVKGYVACVGDARNLLDKNLTCLWTACSNQTSLFCWKIKHHDGTRARQERSSRTSRETYLTKNLTCLWTTCFSFVQPSYFPRQLAHQDFNSYLP